MRTIVRRSQGILQSGASSLNVCSSCRRSFTSSAIKRRTDQYPVFHESSSPELDVHLINARQKALLPYYVNRDQRRLIIREENKARLEYDPVYVQIGAVEERLEYINIKSEIPSAYKVFKKAIGLAETSKDWENIARLLRGFMNTTHKLNYNAQEWIIRKMIEADCQYIVIQLLYEVNKTGISLKHEGIRNRVLLGIFQLAADSEWEEASTKKALTFSEQIVDLLEKPEHGGGSRVTGNEDPRCSPFIAALPLEMASVRAKQHLAGKDEGNKVARYATRLMGIIEQHEIPEKAPSDAEFTTDVGSKKLWEQWISVWHALREAKDVLGDAMPKRELADKVIAKLEGQITAACGRLSAGQQDLETEPNGIRYWKACSKAA